MIDIENKEKHFNYLECCHRLIKSQLNQGRRKYTMYCPTCGVFNTDSSKFCKGCGVKLPESQNIVENDTFSETAADVSTEAFDDTTNSNKPVLNQNDKNDIGVTRKKIGIAIIIFALIIGMAGTFCCVNLSDSFKPLTVYNGYPDPNTGETVIMDSGSIGGNYEAVEYYDSLKWLFIIGGTIIAVFGAFVIVSGAKYEHLPLLRKHGQVVGVDGVMASIEFDDGERSRLRYLTSAIVLVKGDKGSFEIKENMIIAFEREL